ncbi:hypothetical protein GCM10010168_86330 [Actinoplanes ianthinogenes]|uniref:Uncharacterized protein n=1 Tax=Actinoplanes ianthinogenes TaxID=122358 RepID=A0ABN6CK48_9ACTN|nr:hypothetical protein [Actinoplanes ianthinogenes]BCJ45364.1 hypothetical protein Aiant_60210 [Actinoplanes ianthinogenes]GGR54032.1 hypothetical protein GCM10010168_86330 [Actinoplanes ianthinogenes]
MTHPTVPDRKTKRADELERDDWIKLDPADGEVSGPAVVRYVEKFNNGYDGPRVLAIVEGVGDLEPSFRRWGAAKPVRMLTAEEIENAKADDRRSRIALQLEQLAALVRQGRVPLPSGASGRSRSLDIDFHLGSVEEIEQAAAALDVQVANPFGKYLCVDWPGNGRHGEVAVSWSTYRKDPEPKPEPEPLPDPQPASIVEHYHSAGQAGGQGECASECACGTSFSGFDSLAEAVEQVELHIADATGVTYQREPDDPGVPGRRIAPHFEDARNPGVAVDATLRPGTTCEELSDDAAEPTCPGGC